MPFSTFRIYFPEIIPSGSISISLSIVIICETFITESFSNPESSFFKKILPGASANLRLLVITTTITVFILLELNESDWITNTGRLYPGPEPIGESKSAHQIDPRFITILPFLIL